MAEIKLIQAFMIVLATCKNAEVLFKNEDAQVIRIFLSL